jgi:hypothetical protein
VRGVAAHVQATLRQGARRVRHGALAPLQPPSSLTPPSLSPLILTPTLTLALTLALTFTLTPTPRQARQQDAYEYLSHVLDQLQRAERTSAARMGEVPMAGLT